MFRHLEPVTVLGVKYRIVTDILSADDSRDYIEYWNSEWLVFPMYRYVLSAVKGELGELDERVPNGRIVNALVRTLKA